MQSITKTREDTDRSHKQIHCITSDKQSTLTFPGKLANNDKKRGRKNEKAFAGTGKAFFKANLHSHTVYSDGHWSPEQMKDEYKKRGYSILACSDHEHLRDNSALTDADFLMLTAYEISFRDYDDPRPHAFRPVVDLNLFVRKPNETRHIGLHPDAVRWLVEKGCMTQEEFDAIEYADGLRDLHYYPANINRVIRSANENGYLVSINHPMWSLTNAADYCAYEGAWAVEVYNMAAMCAAFRTAKRLTRIFCAAERRFLLSARMTIITAICKIPAGIRSAASR